MPIAAKQLFSRLGHSGRLQSLLQVCLCRECLDLSVVSALSDKVTARTRSIEVRSTCAAPPSVPSESRMLGQGGGAVRRGMAIVCRQRCRFIWHPDRHLHGC